jgi:hypothetical protein
MTGTAKLLIVAIVTNITTVALALTTIREDPAVTDASYLPPDARCYQVSVPRDRPLPLAIAPVLGRPLGSPGWSLRPLHGRVVCRENGSAPLVLHTGSVWSRGGGVVTWSHGGGPWIDTDYQKPRVDCQAGGPDDAVVEVCADR